MKGANSSQYSKPQFKSSMRDILVSDYVLNRIVYHRDDSKKNSHILLINASIYDMKNEEFNFIFFLWSRERFNYCKAGVR